VFTEIRFSDFRQQYPGFLPGILVVLVMLVAIDLLLVQRRANYEKQIVELRAGMTDNQRERGDALAEARGQQEKFMVERVLGATDAWAIPRWVYGDRRLSPPQDTMVVGALGPVAILLQGGAVIYSLPTVGPLRDTAYVLPGAVRANAEDLRAIIPNLTPGTPVYFY
jgi:hypothetical protein